MKDQEEMPQGWQRIGNLLYTLEEDGRYRGKMMYRNRLTVSINGFRSVEETEVGELTERLYTFLATPATLPPFYKEGDAAAKVAGMFPHAPALSDSALAAMLDNHRKAVDEWYGTGDNNRSREATTAEIERGALLAEVARLRATPAPVLSLVEEAAPAAEVAGYHSVQLAQISAGIERLHALDRETGALMRRFYNDATRGKAIKEYNDIDPLPTAPTTPSKEADPKPELESLSAYADLAAEHENALPLSAAVVEDGLIQFTMQNGWPVEATPDFAKFVADACNAAGAGFLADLRAENQKEGATHD